MFSHRSIFQASSSTRRPHSSGAGRARWALVLGGVLLIAAGGRLRAETTPYSGAQVITALPCVITAPGTYALAQDFALSAASGNAIEVDADDVTLDLNGHTVANTCTPLSSDGAIGIFCNNHSRLTVRNGTMRGFWAGVYLYSAPPYSDAGASAYTYGHLVEDLSLCEETGLGVCTYANDSVVRNVRVLRVLGQESGHYYGGAIQINGTGNRVLSCDVGHISNAGGNSTGIYFAYMSAGGCAIGNRINPSFPGGTTQGIVCADGTVKLADNLVAAGVTTPYAGGTDAGNNN